MALDLVTNSLMEGGLYGRPTSFRRLRRFTIEAGTYKSLSEVRIDG